MHKLPNIGDSKGQNIAIILLVVAAIVAVFVILNKVFGLFSGVGDFFKDAQTASAEFLNLKDTPEEAAIRKRIEQELAASAASSSPWNPIYYKSAPSGALLITRAKANELAKQIWDSVGNFYDTPTQALAAFKQLSAKTQVSWLAEVFQSNYNRDLFSWLKDKFDTDTQREVLGTIISYVNNLKAY